MSLSITRFALFMSCLFIVSNSTRASTPSMQPASAAVTHAALSETSITLYVRATALETVLGQLAAAGNVTLDVRWDELAAAGISKDLPIDFSVKNIALRRALPIALNTAAKAANVDGSPCIDILDGGQVLITSRDALFKKHTVNRQYKIADLLGPTDKQRDELVGAIATLIRETVAPDSWTLIGKSAIEISGETLTVSQTEQNHRAIVGRLLHLRDARTRQPAAFEREDAPPRRVALDANVGPLVLRGVSFSDAIDSLRKVTGENIFVNWKSLENVRVTRSLPVTSDLSNLTLERALQQLLDEVGGVHVRLGFAVDEGAISISTATNLARNVVTCVYDVRRAIKGDATREQDLQALLQRVRGIDPLSWQEVGGPHSVRELSGQLIITQTPKVHERIVAELKDVLPDEK